MTSSHYIFSKEQQFADFGCLTAPTEVQMHDITGGTEAATPAPPPCGKCKEKDTEKAAVCYCEQCEELFCNGDEQVRKHEFQFTSLIPLYLKYLGLTTLCEVRYD